MNIRLIIFKNNQLFKEIELTSKNNKYTYMWSRVESANYSFKIIKNGKEFGITYNHTSPFASEFHAISEENSESKSISGFQNGIDILIEYFDDNHHFILYKKKFTRFILNYKKYIDTKPEKIEISGDFNSWIPSTDNIRYIGDTNYEITVNAENGYYEYKYLINGDWFPKEKNKILLIGENGSLFPKGKLGTGTFSYDPILGESTNLAAKAIVHYPKKLIYFNKITEREFEFRIRCQKEDISRVYISIISNKETNKIYELERFVDNTNSFDYFKRKITFENNIELLEYHFILEDGGVKKFFAKNGLVDSNPENYVYDINDKKNNEIFYIPYWSREAIWYNIFPDRFYNGDTYNDPIFNELGPQAFRKNKNYESKFVKEYKWGKDKNLPVFNKNRWCSDFSERCDWEISKEMGINYSLKYARMYGGDILGIKKKIPYLKELGITAIWLNPVFYSYQNHKYGANDFRHISPDFGTIRTSGKLHNVYINSKNPYGNKSYLDILGKNAPNHSELELLEVNLIGENKGKNGYFETDEPSTWVWTESDLIMVDLIKELHKNGIRVIFDGVFNHSSNFNFAFNNIMIDGKKSKYLDWYKFNDFSNFTPIPENCSEEEAFNILNKNKENVKYNGWAGFNTLPEFNTYNSEWKEYIFNITRKWMLGPDGKENDNWMEDDGIDGWRLDVPNCLENQLFWKEWRHVVKECKYDSYITAELWNNAGEDINGGDKFDAVMNYKWLETVIGYFINQGKEFDEKYKINAEQFLLELREMRTWYPLQAVQALQNLNGSHDTDRLYSRIINDKLGRNLEEGKQYEKGYNNIHPSLASNYHPNTTIDWKNNKIKPKDILKLISIFQMTYIGAPMLYYGDEIGMWGATDPYCRKPMLWDEFWYDDEKNNSYINSGEIYPQKPDIDLLEWYKKIIKIRKEHKVLVYGRIKNIYCNNEKDIIVYDRFDKEESIITIINNSFENHNNIEFNIYHKDKILIDLLSGKKVKSDINGKINIDIAAKKGYILFLKKEEEYK